MKHIWLVCLLPTTKQLPTFTASKVRSREKWYWPSGGTQTWAWAYGPGWPLPIWDEQVLWNNWILDEMHLINKHDYDFEKKNYFGWVKNKTMESSWSEDFILNCINDRRQQTRTSSDLWAMSLQHILPPNEKDTANICGI